MNENENNIGDFWENNPCGENLTGRLQDWEAHFAKYDEFRYSTESHILGELDTIDFKDKKVLEIGIGQAADSFQIAKRGGVWHGVDITEAAINRAKIRFQLENMAYGGVAQGSATKLPWSDDSFDIVYSHGVLHHIPDISAVSSEISRVLKPGGQLIVMMYHKNSLNYYLSILVIRRIGLLFVYMLSALGFKPKPNSVIAGHLGNAKSIGLFKYLDMNTFVHHNTDGPSNPYARVYTIKAVQKDFPEFCLDKSKVHFINQRHFPGIKILPKSLYDFFERRFGWHLWAYMKNTKGKRSL